MKWNLQKDDSNLNWEKNKEFLCIRCQCSRKNVREFPCSVLGITQICALYWRRDIGSKYHYSLNIHKVLILPLRARYWKSLSVFHGTSNYFRSPIHVSSYMVRTLLSIFISSAHTPEFSHSLLTILQQMHPLQLQRSQGLHRLVKHHRILQQILSRIPKRTILFRVKRMMTALIRTRHIACKAIVLQHQMERKTERGNRKAKSMVERTRRIRKEARVVKSNKLTKRTKL